MGSQGIVASEDSLSNKGILKKVKKSETEALQRYGVDNFNLMELNEVLNDVYHGCKPVSSDYLCRKNLVHCLNNMAREIYGVSADIPVLEAYGSFVMDLFSPQSDLDISINFNKKGVKGPVLPRDKKLETLRRFATKLRFLEGAGHVMNVESIFSAKVPIVKFFDRGTKVECDLSVENRDGILKSQLIHIISGLDDRFQKLCILMKSWAKAQDINSTRDHTLSSLAIISLVAFHLQTRETPILPPFSVLFADGTDPSSVNKRTQKFLNRGLQNEESLGRLFVTLLIKLQSVESFWDKGLCVSLLNGLWITKLWKKGVIGSISIEDFSERSQNVSRAVRGEGFKKIYSSIHRSMEYIVGFLEGRTPGSRLKDTLFGASQVAEPPLLPRAVYPRPPDYRDEFHDHPRLDERRIEFHDGPPQRHAKRTRLMDGYRAVEAASHWREIESRDRLSGKRIRYVESYNIAPETSHHHHHHQHHNHHPYHHHNHDHIPHFTPPNRFDDDPHSRVPFHGYDPSGLRVPRHGSVLVEERYMALPLPFGGVGLREDHSRRFDGLPFPEASSVRYRPGPRPEPFLNRPFYYNFRL